MSESMQAAVLVEPGRFDIKSVSVPRLGPHDVLIRVARVGICGTDLHIFHGKYALKHLPLILGHEFTGTIAETGTEVKDLNPGVKVVVDMNIGCGKCFWCRRNEILNCPKMQQMGITIDGAMAEYIAVPSALVIPAPELPSSVLALTEPLACVVRCARKSRVTFGQSVAVLGAGPAGNLHVQLLRAIGAAPIIVAETSKVRARMVAEAGADVVVTEPADLREKVLEHTSGRGVDLVIESVGKPELYRQALELTRKGGHIAAFGLAHAGETLEIEISRTILQENSIKGSVAGMGQDMHDSLALLTYNRIRTEFFTRSEYPLDEIQTAFDSFADRPQDLKTQIVIAE